MAPHAYSFVQRIEPEPPREFRVDQHYLLCVSSGSLRLEVDGTEWMLPPARAALITADHAVEIAIPRPAVTSSVLFATTFAAAPSAALSVFDLSPLARALLDECGQWGAQHELSPYAESMFRALAACTWELARTPSPARMPTGRSPELRRALALTAAQMSEQPSIDEIARAVGLTSRSLARRFETELGMTWRASLRRLRLLHAIELLADDASASITTIAMAVGYTSLSAFNAAFRDLVGRTPSDYRSSFVLRTSRY